MLDCYLFVSMRAQLGRNAILRNGSLHDLLRHLIGQRGEQNTSKLGWPVCHARAASGGNDMPRRERCPFEAIGHRAEHTALVAER